jgi:hypothetical protein
VQSFFWYLDDFVVANTTSIAVVIPVTNATMVVTNTTISVPAITTVTLFVCADNTPPTCHFAPNPIALDPTMYEQVQGWPMAGNQ